MVLDKLEESKEECNFMEWLLAELNKLMADEVVIDMVLDNLVVGNSNIANHGVVSVCVKPVSCLEDCQSHCRNINNIIYDDNNILQVEQDDVERTGWSQDEVSGTTKPRSLGCQGIYFGTPCWICGRGSWCTKDWRVW